MTFAPLKLTIAAVDRATATVTRIQKRIDGMTAPIRRVGRSFRGLARAARLPEIGRALRGVGQASARLGRRLFQVVKWLGAIGGVAGAAAIATLRQYAAAGDEIAKTTRRLGINAQAFQELRFVADRAGIAANTFDMALQRFIRRSREAADGTGEAEAAIRFLGIQLKDARGNLRPTEELLGDVSEAMRGIEDPALRVRIAFKLFDSEGVSMLQMLGLTKEEMKAARQEAVRLGYVMSDEALAATEAFTDAMTNAKAGAMGVRNEIGARLLPAIVPLIERFTEWTVANRALIATRVDAFLDRLPGILDRTLEVGREVVAMLRPFVALGRQIVEHFGPAKSIVLGLALVLGAVLLPPILGVIASLVTLGATLGTVGGLVVAGAAAIAGAAVFIVSKWGSFTAFWESLPSVVRGAIQATPIGLLVRAAMEVREQWEPLKSWFSGFFDFLTRGFEKVSGFVERVSGFIPDSLRGVFGGGGSPVAVGAAAGAGIGAAGRALFGEGGTAAGGRTEVGGRIDVHVSDDRVRVSRPETRGPSGFQIEAEAGPTQSFSG